MKNQNLLLVGAVVLLVAGGGFIMWQGGEEPEMELEKEAEKHQGQAGEKMEMAEDAKEAREVEGSFVVNKDMSEVTWSAEKRVGAGHSGTVDIKEGELEVEEGGFRGGYVVIDMTSIEEAVEPGPARDKLETHLKSDDFFGVEQYPEARFDIISVDDLGEGRVQLNGNMMIRGVTKPMVVQAAVREVEDQFMLVSQFVFDRSEYDVKFGSDKFFDDLGDGLIENEVGVSLELVAVSN